MSRRANRPTRLARRGQARRPDLEALEPRELLTAYSVTTAADGGSGSLRAAILAANSDNAPGSDSISFQIAGGGLQTIALKSPLPAITRPVVIDGTTESGYSTSNPRPLVEIDGSGAGAGADGLAFSGGGGSVVRGLSIVGFTAGPNGGGSGIFLAASSANNVIESSYLGVLDDGTTARPNTNGVVIFGRDNKVGSGVASTTNLISGNASSGVLILGAGATGNLVSGNLIGTDQSGFFGVGNTFGVILAGPNNTVGGTTEAAGNVISGNVGPTGQTGAGILFEGPSTGNLVEGNLIGTDSSGGTSGGTGVVENVYGIYFGTPGGSASDNVAQDTIGGTSPGAGNVISGNFLGITGNVTSSLIAGNTIGLASDGTRPIPNGDGILLGASGTTIGGVTPGARNIIAASGTTTGAEGTGLDLTGDANLVQGNYVGLSSGGLGLTGTGNVTGIALHTTNSTIGGTAQGAGNAIANNTGDGLTLDANGGNQILGNLFGRSPTLPVVNTNGGNGISIQLVPPPGGGGPVAPLALNDTIGGTAAGAGNTITGSFAGSGIVRSSYPAAVTGLAIRGNQIYGNGKIGIDLGGSNVPIPGYLFLTSAATSGNAVTVSGVFHGAPGTAYAIDLFGNTAKVPADPSGFGPGQFYLGSLDLTTDAAGFAAFSPTLPTPPVALLSFSGTATGPDGSTSEFSANFPPQGSVSRADLAVTSAGSVGSVVVGGLVTLTETITNSGPGTALDVVFSDAIPTSLVNARITSSTGTATIDSNNVVSATIGTLAPNQSVTLTITGNASRPGTLVDTPGVASTTLDPNYGNNEARQTIDVTPRGGGPTADLVLAQVASPGPSTAGSDLTFTVTVTNNGPADATNVTVNDFLPAGAAYVAATPSQGAPASASGNLISANLGTIAAGSSATLTLVVTPPAAGTYVNAANVSGNQVDPTPGNNSTSASLLVAARPVVVNLLLSASVFPTVGAIGQIQLVTFTVTNSGPDPATNVTIIDALPANSAFLLAAPSQGGFATLANGIITDNLGTIAAGASATLTLVVVPTAAGVFLNFGGVYSPDLPSAVPSFAYGAVNVPAALPGPGVLGLAGSGNNSQLVLTFNEPLNPATATNRANYALIGTGPKGRNRQIAILSATYNAAGNSVVLVPMARLDPTQTYRLIARGESASGIADSQGRRLVGTPGGVPGSNYTADFFAGALPQV